jgi:hypothetical protein
LLQADLTDPTTGLRAGLADRRWLQLPDGTDPIWRAFWNGPPGQHRDGPVVRTVHECLQAVLWNGTIGLLIRSFVRIAATIYRPARTAT